MWSLQKGLANIVNSLIANRNYELFSTFENELNKNYDQFANILRNKPPSANERELIKKAISEPIALSATTRLDRPLQQALVEEALTLSDLFGLSEVACVELLLEAEEQMQFFHGLNRGLTAILLFYDAKKMAIGTLKSLLLARPGRTWTLDEHMPAAIAAYIGQYVDKLANQSGLVAKLLDQILMFEWAKIEDELSRVNGLGTLKHRKQVRVLLNEIRVTIGECVFDLACQSPLELKDTLLVIEFLKTRCQVSASATSSASSSATIVARSHLNSLVVETSHLYLIMALLYCFDCSYLDSKQEPSERSKINAVYFRNDYVKTIYAELCKADGAEWLAVGVKSTLQFAFQIFISLFNGHINESSESEFNAFNTASFNAIEEDELLVDKALEQHVFGFIRKSIVQNDIFHREVRRKDGK